MAGLRHRAQRHLGNDSAALGDGSVETLVLRRIDDIDAAGDDRNRAGGQCGLMSRGIDASGEPRGNRIAPISNLLRKHAGEVTTVGGRIARANDGDRGSSQDLRLSEDGDHRRRVIKRGERARVIRFDERDQPAIQSLQLCEFALGGAARMNLQRLCAPAPVSKIRQCRQRACGGAEAGEQMAKRDRSDILGPDQAQPIKPFDAGEFAFRRGHDAATKSGKPFRVRQPWGAATLLTLTLPALSRWAPVLSH